MIINYTILSYIIFLPVTLFVTFWVGKELHNKGRPLMFIAFQKYDFETWVTPVNNTLLVGYYLLNLGNILLFITAWEKPSTIMEVIVYLTQNIGFMIMLLGVIHVFNLLVLTLMKFKSKAIN